ncbi:MAG: hypothetical protein J0M25_07770, partial [Flavobacteriales bacterium]|nr:hypothetical protein [Flavobacteriales bacterium]
MITEKNNVSYSNLQDGNYTFSVKSANNDGLWGEITTFEIRIATPFWKAWWFYGIILFMIASFLFGLHHF